MPVYIYIYTNIYIYIYVQDTRSHIYIYIYIYNMYQSLGHVPHRPRSDVAGNAGDAVQTCSFGPRLPLSPREPTPQHLSQHPTLNQTTLQPLLNPNPKPKSTQTPNPPETHRKPALNQPQTNPPSPNQLQTTPQTPNHPTTPPPHPHNWNIYSHV